jgi:hypothetical protein
VPDGELPVRVIESALNQLEACPGDLVEHGLASCSMRGLTLELKRVDPATVHHFTQGRSMRLSEVIDEPFAVMMLVTDRNGRTFGPVYAITGPSLAGLKDQMLLQLEQGL